MYDQVNELGSRVGVHSLGTDRWGRSYWSFNAIPSVYIQRSERDMITQPADLNGSNHSEKVWKCRRTKSFSLMHYSL